MLSPFKAQHRLSCWVRQLCSSLSSASAFLCYRCSFPPAALTHVWCPCLQVLLDVTLGDSGSPPSLASLARSWVAARTTVERGSSSGLAFSQAAPAGAPAAVPRPAGGLQQAGGRAAPLRSYNH